MDCNTEGYISSGKKYQSYSRHRRRRQHHPYLPIYFYIIFPKAFMMEVVIPQMKNKVEEG